MVAPAYGVRDACPVQRISAALAGARLRRCPDSTPAKAAINRALPKRWRDGVYSGPDYGLELSMFRTRSPPQFSMRTHPALPADLLARRGFMGVRHGKNGSRK
jgi:hypothetical protein